ncbi:hypothetical protein GE061_003167 [Apolygus lucorum]|uniref:Supervillin n=1 Tax=Apolygus lucorum TaxID=248454 RepID=A0A8S9X5B3_APOLU|nr:hypothetical protein GE061_003167 [Apolygus lucorum]
MAALRSEKLEALIKLYEEYVGRCDRGGMVGPTQNMSSATKDERIARYKEERRRQLAAQFGPRDSHQQPLGAIRSTRASRLRTQANSESIKGSKDLSSKDVDSPTYFPKSRLIKPSSPQLPDVSIESYQKKCTMVSPNVGGVCSPRGAKKPSATTTPPSSSPIPRSAQLVKRASLHERESSPVSAIPLSQSPREPTNGISCSSPSISSTTISSGNVTPLRVSTLLITGRQSPPSSPSPTRHPSILKKSSIEEVQVSSNLTAPVSILKRKTSGDTTNSARCHSPLRFSPNTVDKKGRGILKKHRSLDETQVINGNLEVTNGVHDTDEPRPILKGQPRRCSLEEVVKRTLSPEPQGILKRKASREETEVPTENILHPHGILKKKSSVTEEPAYESLDCPRPILKKKSSSEEEEYIKSILKVSSRKSLEGDDAEQKKEDIKPILKHSDEVVLRPKKTNSEKRVTSLDLSLFCRPGSGGEGRPPSVAERVNGLEILLNIKKDELSMRMEEGDGNTTLVRRGSVNERASLFNQIDEKEKAEAEASKTRRTLRGPRNRSRTEEGSRFRTQPVTFDEVEQAKRNNDPDCEDPSNLSLAQRVKLFSSLHSTEKLNSGGTTPVAVTPPQPAPRKLLSSPLMSGVLVEGLMKNLAGKDGAPVKIRIGRSDESAEDSSSSESSDSEVDGEIGDGACRRLLGGGETVGFRRREESSSEEASSGGREVQDILRRQT